MPIVTTGQLTIVDNNDARPITAFISITPSAQQVYNGDEGASVFTPDWSTANTNLGLELRARVFAGKASSSEDVTFLLTNKKWSYDLGTAISAGAASTAYWNESAASGVGSIAFVDDSTNGVRMRIRANLKPNLAPITIYFEGDYQDPSTGLVSRVVSSITLSQVKTGTNAVFVQLRAVDGTVLEPDSPVGPKSTLRVYADLMRASGVDNTGVTYKWFQSPHNTADQIDANLASVATKYGLMDTLAVGANRTGAIGFVSTGAASATAAMSTVTDGAFGDYKGLMIHFSAVSDIGVYKVEIKDASNAVYQTYFTVYDVSDPYEVRMVSTAGDKLQNGIGSTSVYPQVYYGQDKVTNLTGWTFTWFFYDKDGSRGAFVDTTRTSVAGGRDITSNTTTTIVYNGAVITLVAGDIVKAVAGGTAHLFEVASFNTNTITLRSPSTNAWISASNFSTLTSNKFQNGKLFVMFASRTTNGANNNDAAAAISVSGDDIDAKGTIVCEVNKP